MSFTYALTLLFIGLKLTSVIDWSWWLVLSPIIVPIFVSLTLIVAGLLASGGTVRNKRTGKRWF